MLYSAVLYFPVPVSAQSGWPTTVLPDWEKVMPAKALYLDKLGQVYLVNPANQVFRYDVSGDSRGIFAQPALGQLAAVDVSDPLSPLLWYPDFQAIVLLDRTMGLLATLYLPDEIFAFPTLVARGRDNRIWVFDKFHNRLIGIDAQGRLIGQSQELHLGGESPKDPQLLIGDEEGFFLVDSLKGIWRFDRLAQFQYFLPLESVDALFPLANQQVLIRQEGRFFMTGVQQGGLQPFNFPFTGVLIGVQPKIVVTWGEGILRYFRQ